MTNVERSNKWGVRRRLHVALHSNARSSMQCGSSGGGTIVFYFPGSKQGKALARRLKSKLGRVSPGREYEYVRSHTLYELKHTQMPTAYVEAEFHDWWRGTRWLRSYKHWAWRIAYAIDLHLDYPNARPATTSVLGDLPVGGG